MEFSRQEYWSGLPCPPPGDLPNQGIESRYSALQADSLPPEPPDQFSSVQWVSHVRLFATPWIAACQASLALFIVMLSKAHLTSHSRMSGVLRFMGSQSVGHDWATELNWGLPVHHQLPEFTQTNVHGVGDAIQPSCPLSSLSPPTFSLSQNQGANHWIASPKPWQDHKLKASPKSTSVSCNLYSLPDV